MQRLSSEATTSCPSRDASALPEHDQRAAISFFNGVVITKSSIATYIVVYADQAFVTQNFLYSSVDKSAYRHLTTILDQDLVPKCINAGAKCRFVAKSLQD